MSIAVSAPLYTFGLFTVCFFLATFLKLALGKRPPEEKRRRPPKKRSVKRNNKIYFLTDVKRFERKSEPEKVLMEGLLSDDDPIR